MIINKRLFIDVNKFEDKKYLCVKQYDNNVYRINISLLSGEQEITIPPSSEVTIAIKKPDGTICFDNCELTDNVISFIIDEKITSSYGDANCEIRIYSEQKSLMQSPTFVIKITKAAVKEDDIVSSDDFSELTKLISEVKELTNLVADLSNKNEILYQKLEEAINKIPQYDERIDSILVAKMGELEWQDKNELVQEILEAMPVA